jgi:hypothetical protein
MSTLRGETQMRLTLFALLVVMVLPMSVHAQAVNSDPGDSLQAAEVDSTATPDSMQTTTEETIPDSTVSEEATEETPRRFSQRLRQVFPRRRLRHVGHPSLLLCWHGYQHRESDVPLRNRSDQT